MKSGAADLCFDVTHKPVGFTSGELAHFDGSAEPVIRDLLQNSLDAADQAGRPAEVEFVICETPKEALPGHTAYSSALRRAREDRSRWTTGRPSHHEQTILDRIQKTLDGPAIPLLLCIDNGHGLNARRMTALLTPGNTSKGDRGAGSFGLGHYAAFGASNLRYVLYAARYRNRRGRIKRIASGHAILASHPEPGKSRHRHKPQLLAADGYWNKPGQTQLSLWHDQSYPESAPDLLASHLKRMKGTGTVVCVAGFNDFHREPGDPSAVEQISRVAAANFSDAICSGRLKPSARDDRGSGEKTEITSETLDELLEPVSKQKRAKKQGQMSGANAYAAVLTLNTGEQVDCPDGQTLRWRTLAGVDWAITQVHVFRRGMWITSRAPGLRKGDFSRQEPFDAVLSLNSGPLEQLVRNAEGPEHRGLDRKRLNTTQKRELQKLIADTAERLRNAVGERGNLDEFVPAGFATLETGLNRAAETVRRPRAPSGGGSRNRQIEGGENITRSGGPKLRRTGVPRPGSAPKYRAALAAAAGSPVVETLLEYGEKTSQGSRIGVRVRAVSGADGSCDRPLPDTWLPILSITDNNGEHVLSAETGGSLELGLSVKAGERRLTVTLAEPVSDPALLELDIVRRKHRPKNTGPGSESIQPVEAA